MPVSKINKKQEISTEQEKQLESTGMQRLQSVIRDGCLRKMLGMQETETKRMVSAHERGIKT